MSDKIGLAAAIERVRSLGLVTEREHLVLLDREGKWKREQAGDRYQIDIRNPATGEVGIEAGDTIVHSHPIESGLSLSDLQVAARYQARIIATTPSGCIFTAQPVAGMADWVLALMHTKARNMVLKALDGHDFSQEQENLFGTHYLCRALAGAGIMKYTADLSPGGKRIVEEVKAGIWG